MDSKRLQLNAQLRRWSVVLSAFSGGLATLRALGLILSRAPPNFPFLSSFLSRSLPFPFTPLSFLLPSLRSTPIKYCLEVMGAL